MRRSVVAGRRFEAETREKIRGGWVGGRGRNIEPTWREKCFHKLTAWHPRGHQLPSVHFRRTWPPSTGICTTERLVRRFHRSFVHFSRCRYAPRRTSSDSVTFQEECSEIGCDYSSLNQL